MRLLFAQDGSIATGKPALVGGTICVSPAEAPILNDVVLIKDVRIAAVGPGNSVKLSPGVKVLDCSGLTIAAGLWNSHVHFVPRKLTGQLHDMLNSLRVY